MAVQLRVMQPEDVKSVGERAEDGACEETEQDLSAAYEEGDDLHDQGGGRRRGRGHRVDRRDGAGPFRHNQHAQAKTDVAAVEETAGGDPFQPRNKLAAKRRPSTAT